MEGVPHIPRRVVRGHVEQAEVVIVGLHLARAVDLEAHLAPDAVDLAQHAGGDVQPPNRGAATRQGNVQLFGLQAAAQRFGLDRFLPVGQGGFEGLLHLVGRLPDQRAQLLGRLAQPREHQHHRGAAPQVSDAPGFQPGFVVRAVQRRQPLGANLIQFLHAPSLVLP